MLRTVRATCVMAMVIAGCGGVDPHGNDGGDAPLNRDVLPADHPNDSNDGAVTGSDGRVIDADGSVAQDGPCFVPADCLPGLVCCLRFADPSSGTVSCQPSAVCPGDGVTTYRACEAAADCPPAASTCTFLTTVSNGRPFNVCTAP